MLHMSSSSSSLRGVHIFLALLSILVVAAKAEHNVFQHWSIEPENREAHSDSEALNKRSWEQDFDGIDNDPGQVLYDSEGGYWIYKRGPPKEDYEMFRLKKSSSFGDLQDNFRLRKRNEYESFRLKKRSQQEHQEHQAGQKEILQDKRGGAGLDGFRLKKGGSYMDGFRLRKRSVDAVQAKPPRNTPRVLLGDVFRLGK